MRLFTPKRQTGRRRKQQRLRRVEAATTLSMPRTRVPDTARKRRRRNKRRLRFPTAALKRVLLSSRWISLFLLVIAAGALVLTGLDTHFYLTLIPVEGARTIAPQEVVAASGLAGQHTFTVDPNVAASRIAELPGVISATVSVSWPDSVHIRIREDSPIAIWQQGGERYWVNEVGHLLPARGQANDLLAIQAEDAVPATGGVEDEAADPLLFVPQAVLDGALQLQRLRPGITTLYYKASGGLSFQDERGWRVYLGSGTDMAQKLVVYEAIVDALRAQGKTPAYVSISNQEKPFYALQ